MDPSTDHPPPTHRVPIHPGPIHPVIARACHWINALAMVGMIGSGWRIYNAAPFLPIAFPDWLTLGGWLGGALAIHFACLWLLATNFTAWLAWSLATGRLRRLAAPVSLASLRRDAAAALSGRIVHAPGRYNAVQALLYLLALLGIGGAIVSGAVLWKPVQFHAAAVLMGGYEGVRRVHFAAMAGLVLFIALHLAMVALVPSTLRPMLTGRPARRPSPAGG